MIPCYIQKKTKRLKYNLQQYINMVKRGYYIPNIAVGKKAGRNNKYIVYDKDNMTPLSGMSGQTKIQAQQIAKRISIQGILKPSRGKYGW